MSNKDRDLPGQLYLFGEPTCQYRDLYSIMIQDIHIPSGLLLSRENINELGRRGPYFTYYKFPTDIKVDKINE